MKSVYWAVIFIFLLSLWGCGGGGTRGDLSTWNKENVIRLAGVTNPSMIKLASGYYRVYFVATNEIVSAISTNEGAAFSWEAGSRLSPVSGSTLEVRITNPCVVHVSDATYRMYYEGLSTTESNPIRRIFSAISYDQGSTFYREGVCITPEVIADENAISSPFVVKLPDSSYRMYYVSCGFKIKSATSESGNGQTFIRESSSILGSSYEDAAVAPFVIRLSTGNYKLFYGTDWNISSGGPNKIMSATASNGVSFSRDGNILIDLGQTLDTKLVTKPNVFQLNSSIYRMFYAGTTDGTTYNLLSATKESTGI